MWYIGSLCLTHSLQARDITHKKNTVSHDGPSVTINDTPRTGIVIQVTEIKINIISNTHGRIFSNLIANFFIFIIIRF